MVSVMMMMMTMIMTLIIIKSTIFNTYCVPGNMPASTLIVSLKFYSNYQYDHNFTVKETEAQKIK
jgi:hypothetical protein